MPSLLLCSDSEDSSLGVWGTGFQYPDSVERSTLWQGDVDSFERDVDQSLTLDPVECDVGGGLLQFADDVVVVRGGEGFDIRSQVAYRSSGPPGSSGSGSSPIYVE